MGTGTWLRRSVTAAAVALACMAAAAPVAGQSGQAAGPDGADAPALPRPDPNRDARSDRLVAAEEMLNAPSSRMRARAPATVEAIPGAFARDIVARALASPEAELRAAAARSLRRRAERHGEAPAVLTLLARALLAETDRRARDEMLLAAAGAAVVLDAPPGSRADDGIPDDERAAVIEFTAEDLDQPGVRGGVTARALGELARLWGGRHAEAAADALAATLTDEAIDTERKSRAVFGLARAGEAGDAAARTARETLLSLLGDPALAEPAARALAGMEAALPGEDDHARTVERIRAAAGHHASGPLERLPFLAAVGLVTPAEAAADVTALLDGTDPGDPAARDVRARCAAALGSCDTPAAAERLVVLCGDTDRRVAAEAGRALSRLADPAGARALAAAAADAIARPGAVPGREREGLRRAAQAVRDAGTARHATDEYLALLGPDIPPWARAAAVRALAGAAVPEDIGGLAGSTRVNPRAAERERERAALARRLVPAFGALVARHAPGGDDGTGQERGDPVTAAAALEALAALPEGRTDAADRARGLLAEHAALHPRLRDAAVRAVAGVPDHRSLSVLADVLETGRGRVRREAAHALWRLTAADLGDRALDADAWRAWIRGPGREARLPGPDEPRYTEPPTARGSGEADDLRLHARSVHFVADLGVAAGRPAGSDERMPRGVRAARVMAATVRGLPDDAHVRLTALRHGRAEERTSTPLSAGADGAEALLALVDGLPLEGGADHLAGIEAALDGRPEVVVLLACWWPTAGDVREPALVAREAELLVQDRATVLVVVTVGAAPDAYARALAAAGRGWAVGR